MLVQEKLQGGENIFMNYAFSKRKINLFFQRGQEKIRKYLNRGVKTFSKI